MNSQDMFDWLIGIGGAVVGWMLKLIWEAIRDMRVEIKDLDKQMHDDFVRRDDFKEAIQDIKTDMRLGFDKVDTRLGMLFKKLDQQNTKE